MVGMRRSSRASLSESLRTFEGRMSLLCGALACANFLAVFVMLDEDRTIYAAGVPQEAVLWWPAPTTATYCLLFAPLVASVVFALSEKYVLAARSAVAVMAATLAMMIVGDYGAVSSGVAIHPDRITQTRWGADRLIPLSDIIGVEVGCSSQWSRRGGRRSYPIYNLVLVHGGRIQAGDAGGWRNDWVFQLAALDEQLALLGIVSVPNRNVIGAPTDLDRCRGSWTSSGDSTVASAVASIFKRVQTSTDRNHPVPIPG